MSMQSTPHFKLNTQSLEGSTSTLRSEGICQELLKLATCRVMWDDHALYLPSPEGGSPDYQNGFTEHAESKSYFLLENIRVLQSRS